jgi:vacuolar iron transporter family protein
MAVGNYLASKTRLEYIEKARRREEWEIDNLVEQGNKRFAKFMQKRVLGRSAIGRNRKDYYVRA